MLKMPLSLRMGKTRAKYGKNLHRVNTLHIFEQNEYFMWIVVSVVKNANHCIDTALQITVHSHGG